jgi:lipopolysaccharide export system protein LptA
MNWFVAPHPLALLAALMCLMAMLAQAHAALADAAQPLSVESDQPGKIDLKKNIVEFNGHVVVTKGSLTLQASRIEIRETPGGQHQATAIGTASKPAKFRQKRAGLNEFIEGVAERLQYDTKTETVEFIHNAAVRRLRGSQVADEISGERVSYNNRTEVFNVTGSANSRVRAVLTPKAQKASPETDETPTPSRGNSASSAAQSAFGSTQ